MGNGVDEGADVATLPPSNLMFTITEPNRTNVRKKQAMLDMEVLNGKFKSAEEIKAYLQI